MGSLEGKVYAITGAASGIGLSTAQLLLNAGAQVSVCDIQHMALQNLLISTDPDGTRTHFQKVDVRNRDQVHDWISRTIAKFGRLDGAANVAGVIPPSHNITTIADQSDGEWDYVFDVNVRGVMNCLRAQIPNLRDGGSIVNIGSGLSLQGRGAAAAYAASKHAVVGLTRSAAKEAGSKGIRVNCVAPGYVLTPMMERAQTNQTNAAQENPGATALGRFGKPEEVAEVIVFLLSEKSSFVTGATICVDGGWNC